MTMGGTTVPCDFRAARRRAAFLSRRMARANGTAWRGWLRATRTPFLKKTLRAAFNWSGEDLEAVILSAHAPPRSIRRCGPGGAWPALRRRDRGPGRL